MGFLRVEDLSVRIGGLQILDGVSLEVPDGKIIGLIGPNGAGKTTVFNVISGFVHPTGGSVMWDGKRLKGVPHRLPITGISRTLQAVGLFDSMTALDNVMVGAFKQRRGGVISALLAAPWTWRQEAKLRAKARTLLGRLDLADVADVPVAGLPYPIRKRIALARALISEPELVMLDEPAGGIGQEDIDKLADLLRSWIPRRSVLVVEHHMDFVMSICDFIYVLDAGRIIAAGTPAEIQRDPAVRLAYLGQEDA
jgi:branched-chain amino acid transport system ATP-binding protein